MFAGSVQACHTTRPPTATAATTTTATVKMLCASGRHQYHWASVLGVFIGQHSVAIARHHQVHSSMYFSTLTLTSLKCEGRHLKGSPPQSKLDIVAAVLSCMSTDMISEVVTGVFCQHLGSHKPTRRPCINPLRLYGFQLYGLGLWGAQGSEA